MRKIRSRYLILCSLTIAMGLLSRKVYAIPAFTGDLLYAVMMYWIWRFLLPQKPKTMALILAVGICFFIEFLQLIDTPFFKYLHHHPYLRLVFGQGFLWSDLLAYCAGGSMAFTMDALASRHKKKPHRSVT